MKQVQFIKIGCSAFILWHLMAALLIPNSQTYLGQVAAPWMEPYIDFFELATNWGFFAPEAGPPPFFIEYQLEKEKGEILRSELWPSYPNPFFLVERQNRRLALLGFMNMADAREEKMLAPYLCAQNPEAVSVSLWKIDYSLPKLVDASHGVAVTPMADSPSKHWLSHSFCKEYPID